MRSIIVKKSIEDVFLPLLAIATCTAITLAVLEHYFHSSGLSEIKNAVRDLYQPNYNICLAPRMAGIHFYFFIYIVSLLSLALLGLIRKIRKNQETIYDPLSASSTVFFMIFVLFPIVAILQTISLATHGKKEFKIFAGKTMEEKYTAITGSRLYSFVRYCRDILPGHHNTQFLTDMDLSKDPGMLTHRVLAYFLYPIDIRGVRDGRTDSLIIFDKKNAVASIPDDFRILGTFDQYSIVAIRKDTP